MSYQLNSGVATVTLDDGKANVVGHNLLDELNGALDRAEAEAKAVILMGREGIFSGGFDLKELNKGSTEGAALVNRGTALFHRLFGFPMPLIGACSGHAIAAGAFLLLCCDTRVGANGPFKIGLNETAIGLPFTVFGHELVNSRLSKRHITPAVIQSRLYSPELAIDPGYLDEVTDSQQLLARCSEIATELLQLPTESYAAMKRDVRQGSLAKIHASIN